MNIPMIDRACPLCNSASESDIYAQSNIDLTKLDGFAFASRKLPEYMHHRLMRCKCCDLIYASPVPSSDFLGDAYEAAAYDSPVEARFASRTYGKLIQSILPRLSGKQTAMDIGTGEGSFLEELIALGFAEVVGVEPSEAPIAAAKPEIKPKIIKAMFSAELFKDKQFDLITCFQTIEHLSDPLAVCKTAASLLKPGGALVLVGHSHRAVSAKVLRKKSPIFDIEHLQLFSKTSAAILLKNAGLTDVTVRSFANKYPMHYWTKLFPLPAKMKPSLINGLKTVGIGHLPIPLPVGNLVIIGYKPR